MDSSEVMNRLLSSQCGDTEKDEEGWQQFTLSTCCEGDKIIIARVVGVAYRQTLDEDGCWTAPTHEDYLYSIYEIKSMETHRWE